MTQKSISKVNLFASRLSERAWTLVSHDAHHFDPFRFGSSNAYQDALSDSGPAGKGLRRQYLIDDNQPSFGCIVRLHERATCDESGSERFEVTR